MRTLTVFIVPLLLLTGVLLVSQFTPNADPCAGGVPGCGSVRNAGDTAVTLQATDGGDVRTIEVPAGERVVMSSDTSAIRVEPDQCLMVEGGPFWSAVSYTDRTGQDTGVWHPIDDWGARVHLATGSCPT